MPANHNVKWKYNRRVAETVVVLKVWGFIDRPGDDWFREKIIKGNMEKKFNIKGYFVEKETNLFCIDRERRTRINGWKFQASSFLINVRLTFLIIRMFYNQLLMSFPRLLLFLLAEFIVFLNIPGSFSTVPPAKVTNTRFLFLPISSAWTLTEIFCLEHK